MLNYANRRLIISTTDAKGNIHEYGDLAAMCSISAGGGALMPTARVHIYNLSIQEINRLTSVRWMTKDALRNMLIIDCEINGVRSNIFKGNITTALPDFSGAPDISIIIESATAILNKVSPLSSAFSKDSEVKLIDIAKEICEMDGLHFESYGIDDKKIESPYLSGSSIEMLRFLADACDVDMYIDGGIVAMCKRGIPRPRFSHVISPQTGLVGYPSPTLQGISCQCIYSPSIRFGGTITVENSAIEQCNGNWRIYGINSILGNNIPNSPWFSNISASFIADTGVKIAGK